MWWLQEIPFFKSYLVNILEALSYVKGSLILPLVWNSNDLFTRILYYYWIVFWMILYNFIVLTNVTFSTISETWFHFSTNSNSLRFLEIVFTFSKISGICFHLSKISGTCFYHFKITISLRFWCDPFSSMALHSMMVHTNTNDSFIQKDTKNFFGGSKQINCVFTVQSPNSEG